MNSSQSSMMRDLWPSRARPVLLALCLLYGVPAAWAACTRLPGVPERLVNMDMGNVLIHPSTPVGGVIASQDFPIQANGPNEMILTCSAPDGTANGVMLQGAPVPGFQDVYST